MSDSTAFGRSKKLTVLLAGSAIMAILTIGLLYTREFGLNSTQVTAISALQVVHIFFCLVVALDKWPRMTGQWYNSIYWFGLYLWTLFWSIGFGRGAFESDLLTGLLLNFVFVLVIFDDIYQGYDFDDTHLLWRGAFAITLVMVGGLIGFMFDIGWDAFGRSTLTGVGLGSIYALATIGFVIVYNTTDVLNFAQGALVLAGGYVMVLILDLGISVGLAPLALLAVGVVFGLFLERSTFRYLIGSSELSIIVITLALIQIISGVLMILVGGQAYRGYPKTLSLGDVTLPLGFSLQGSFLLAIVLAISILAVLVWFFTNTVVGPALRSAGSHQAAAAVLGISITQTIKLAWILSITLAMVSGVLLGIAQGGVHFGMDHVIILVFAAAIFGGLDSLVGAFVGSLTVGLLEIYGSLYFVETFGDGFGPILPMLFLLAVLMIKPSGLWGTERIERL